MGRTVPAGAVPLPDGSCTIPMGPCGPAADGGGGRLALEYNEYIVYRLDQARARARALVCACARIVAGGRRL